MSKPILILVHMNLLICFKGCIIFIPPPPPPQESTSREIRDMAIAGLNFSCNKKAKTNVERESIFYY